MEQGLLRPKTALAGLALPRPGWEALLLAPGLAAWAGAVLLAGGSLWQMGCFLAAFAVCLMGAGSFVVRRLAPQLPPVWQGDGAAAAFLAGCAAVFCSHSLVWALGRLLPALQGLFWLPLLPCWLLGGRELALLLRQQPKGPAPPGEERTLRLAACGLVTLCLGLFALYGVLPFAPPDRLKAWVYNQDMLWSVGNAASARFGLPFGDLRAAGLPLNYHFLNDAAAGILARGVGVSAWHGLCFYWNAAVLALGVFAFVRLGTRLGAGPLLAGAAGWLVWLGSTQGNVLPANLFSNANAQSTALLALCGLLAVFGGSTAARGARQLAGCAALGFVVFGAGCMIKSPVGLLALLGCWAAVAVGSCTRQLRAGCAAVAAGGAAAFGLVYLLVLGRATNNLVFTSLASLRQLPAALGQYLSPLLAAVYLLGLCRSLAGLRRLDMLRLAVNAIAVGGMLAYVLYQHYSFSQVYFALTAVPCAALSALPQKRENALPQSWRRPAALLGAAALCACLGRQLYLEQGALRTGVQAALRCAGLRESQATELTITPQDWAAAAWLRANTPENAVFLSNRNNRQFDAADGVFHFYSAASERRCYIESYRYAMDYDHAYHEIRRRLEQVSDPIYTALPEAEAFALARAEGVGYILVSSLSPQVPNWDAPPVYQNELVRIYEVGGGQRQDAPGEPVPAQGERP